MNTNNEQAKAEQRAPIMTAEHARAMLDTILHNSLSNGDSQELAKAKANAWAAGMWNASDFYENLITSGELMVVNTAHDDEDGACTNCGHLFYVDDSGPKNFCPGCGAKIIE